MLLAWEQGLGKTVISLAGIDKLFSLGKADKALIVPQAGTAWQWDDAFKEFTDLKVKYVTAKDKTAREYNVGKYESWIVPYPLYRNDFKKFVRAGFQIVVADEATEFSSTRSKTRKLFLAHNRIANPRYRWALTGTAISTKLEELYAILYWVDRDFLPSWPDFEEHHIVRDHFGRISDYKNLKELNVYIQKRVDHKDHTDMEGKLPKILPRVETVERDKVYDKAERNFLKVLDKIVDELKFDADGNVVKTRAGGPARKAFHEVRQTLIGPKIGPASKLLVSTYAENRERNRQVLFSYCKPPIAELGKLLDEQGVPNFRFTGDEDPEIKRSNVQKFKEVGGVLLCSNAGAMGLDLPFANYVTHLDIPLSWRIVDQRNKRIRRRTSTFGSVVVNYLVIADSVELYFLQTLKAYGALNAAVFKGKYDEVTVKPQSLRQFLKNGSR